jgi:hypothetical protein
MIDERHHFELLFFTTATSTGSRLRRLEPLREAFFNARPPLESPGFCWNTRPGVSTRQETRRRKKKKKKTRESRGLLFFNLTGCLLLFGAPVAVFQENTYLY